MRTRTLALLLTAGMVSACGMATSTAAPPDRELITSADLARADAQTAYEAVSELQPQWLTSRGPASLTDATPTEAAVYVNGVEAGGIAYLRNIDVIGIAEIRYFPPGEASARFGMGHPRGVIDVRMKGG